MIKNHELKRGVFLGDSLRDIPGLGLAMYLLGLSSQVFPTDAALGISLMIIRDEHKYHKSLGMDVCLSEYVPSMKNTVSIILLDPLCTVWSASWTSTMLLSIAIWLYCSSVLGLPSEFLDNVESPHHCQSETSQGPCSWCKPEPCFWLCCAYINSDLPRLTLTHLRASAGRRSSKRPLSRAALTPSENPVSAFLSGNLQRKRFFVVIS